MAALAMSLVAVTVFGLWRDAKQARDDAQAQRGLVEKARAGEEDSRKAVEREREKLASVEYGRTVQMAHSECLTNNQARACTARWHGHGAGVLRVGVVLRQPTGQLGLTAHPQGAHEVGACGVVQRGRVAGGHRSEDQTVKVWDARTGAEKAAWLFPPLPPAPPPRALER